MNQPIPDDLSGILNWSIANTTGAAIFIVAAFAVILLVSRSNSPAHYSEAERQAERGYEDHRGSRGGAAAAGNALFGILVFAVGALLFHAADYAGLGVILMLLGAGGVLIVFLGALFSHIRS